MSLRRHAAFLSIAAVVIVFALPAQAMSMEECTAKFKNAKDSNTLNGQKWTDFRTTECGFTAKADAQTSNVSGGPVESAAAAVNIPASVTFPNTIDGKFASEKPARQRMKTCLEAYHTNKKANTLSGLRWIQKGGGYYSICNTRLLKGNS